MNKFCTRNKTLPFYFSWQSFASHDYNIRLNLMFVNMFLMKNDKYLIISDKWLNFDFLEN